MPSEITLPPPTLSLKKATHSYLTGLTPLSAYELEKDTKLDISNAPFNQMDITGSTDVAAPKTKETRAYTLKQLFAGLRLFTTTAEDKLSSEEKLFEEFENEGQTLGDDMLHLALNADLLEHRPDYSPVKSAYILSLEKLRNCKERPMVQVLLIHQTMTRLQCSVTVNGLHPSLIERRVLEKAAFLRRVGKATYSQVAPISTPTLSKQHYIPPPPPYSRFENAEVVNAEEIIDSGDDNDDSDDDDDIPLGLLQTYFQNRQKFTL
ncbi:hypothetical protein K493DRAFT_310342 [Basidiobolus meristosporus CBS 931.73]|uniref:Uncharacterized protein n=1 Tax=Basidiobolus meristosporus CBS 931.73 TaxID=1314790 RepID=A0A1Y1ZA32_9FUNG|nr:hypothetical protein K493DRAFT_310342 [Basidiobolus meristosporus CBS 931.73]|eukprot:ORY07119.1 hypothetical protein K493DRAFT_310342 [Basidiobolus meristosporus CBS 931.73]